MSAAVLICAAPLLAQEDQAKVEDATLQLLLKRIDQLEARVKQLEGEKQQGLAVEPAPIKTPIPAPLAGMDGSPTATPIFDEMVRLRPVTCQSPVIPGLASRIRRRCHGAYCWISY